MESGARGRGVNNSCEGRVGGADRRRFTSRVTFSGDRYYLSAVADRFAGGFDDAVVVGAVGSCRDEACPVDFVQNLRGIAGIHAKSGLHDALNRTIAVADGDHAGASGIHVLEIVGAGLGVGGGADVAVLQAAVLVGMTQPRAFLFAFAVEGHTLGVGAGRGIGEAECVLDVETGAVVPDDAGIGPQVRFAAVGEAVGNSVHAHGDGGEA